MGKHIRKSVSLPKIVYETVKSIAEAEGRNFSDVLSTVVRSVIDGDEEKVVKVFKDKLRLAELKAIAYEIHGKKVALEQLAKLEEEIDREIERVEFEVRVAWLKYHLEKLWDFFNYYGDQTDKMDAQTRRAVQEVDRLMKEHFGKSFSVEQFFEECFLNDDYEDAETGISDWLYKYLNTQ